jgi:hypothetical protein
MVGDRTRLALSVVPVGLAQPNSIASYRFAVVRPHTEPDEPVPLKKRYVRDEEFRLRKHRSHPRYIPSPTRPFYPIVAATPARASRRVDVGSRLHANLRARRLVSRPSRLCPSLPELTSTQAHAPRRSSPLHRPAPPHAWPSARNQRRNYHPERGLHRAQPRPPPRGLPRPHPTQPGCGDQRPPAPQPATSDRLFFWYKAMAGKEGGGMHGLPGAVAQG